MGIETLKHKIPIIMPVFNNLEYTQKAIASLQKHTNPNLYECVIIDNGSTDDTPNWLKWLTAKFPENFRSLRNEKNLGFGGGMNKGLDLISSFDWEFVVLANNDLLFTEKWLEHMVDTFQRTPIPKIGIVGPLSNLAGGTQGIQANYRTVADLDNYVKAHRQMYRGQWHESGIVVGLLMLISRQFIDDVGVFDERFFPGCSEELDLEYRGAIKGYRYVVDRSTFVHHFGSKTLAAVKESQDQRANFRLQRKRLRDKWADPVESPHEILAAERYHRRGMDPEKYRKPNGRLHKWIVSACRVKNGAPWMDKTLARESEFADEIVILVDQATTDNTEEICRKYPKVVLLEREEPHPYDEAASRQRVLDMAASRHPDWIRCFDHDEIIEEAAIARRDELTDPPDPGVNLWIQPIVQLWNDNNTQRVDGLWGNFYQGRMFRNLPNQSIENAAAKVHSGSTPFFPPDSHGFSYLKIAHYGNVDSTYRKQKYDWYTKTDTQKNLDIVLGGHKHYYWQLYYGQPNQQEMASFAGKWSVVADDASWKRPPYGTFYSRDVYRHVYDETGLALVPYGDKPTVSLCMLVKNEAEFLPKVVASVRPFINELIVIDTGSVDGSDVIAEHLGAKVYPFEWVDDFSAARNFSLSKATGDWILRLDPDETMPWNTAVRLPQLVRDERMDGYVFPITNWLQTPRTPNAQWALSETCRLFKNMYPEVKYKNPVHEELDDDLKALSEKRVKELLAKGISEAQAREAGKVKIAKVPFTVDHFGYLRGREFLDKKFNYYYELGGKHLEDNPSDFRPFFNRAVHLLHIGKYSEAAKSYMRCLELDPKNFLAWNDMGVIYSTFLGEPIRAEECFKKALASMDVNTHPEHRHRVEKNLDELRVKILAKLLNV